ncbi:hypothetical protein ACFL6S_23985 [Candidatus Poribacteria bacterium]
MKQRLSCWTTALGLLASRFASFEIMCRAAPDVDAIHLWLPEE